MNFNQKSNFQFTEICSTNMAHLRFNAALHRLSSSQTSLSYGYVLTLPCDSPLMTPSSPNTTPLLLLDRCCCPANTGASGWSSVSGPRPEPGRRHMTLETRWRPRQTSYCKVAKNKSTPIVLPIYKFRFYVARLTLPGQFTAWLKKWPHYIQLLPGTSWGNPWTWFLKILHMSGHTNSWHSPTTHEQMTSTPPLVMSHPSPPWY